MPLKLVPALALAAMILIAAYGLACRAVSFNLCGV